MYMTEETFDLSDVDWEVVNQLCKQDGQMMNLFTYYQTEPEQSS
jgi:hypothetical protein